MINPIGALFAHFCYPGVVDLPPNTQYLLNVEDREVLVHLLRLGRGVNIIDPKNAIYEEKEGQLAHPKLVHSMQQIERDSVHMIATGKHGNKGTLIVLEQHSHGRIFGPYVYTEFIVGSEVYGACC